MNFEAPPPAIENPASLLGAGMAAARSGDEALARTLLSRVVTQDEGNATAWLWLSSVVDNLADLEVCLENVALLEPENVTVRQRLAWVRTQQAGLRSPAATTSQVASVAVGANEPLNTPPVIALTSDQPHPLDVHRLFICPQCASPMRFNPQIVDLQCQACGYVEIVEERPVQPPERVLNFVLQTQRAYRWASAERLLRCQQCGAQTIFPPAQTSLACPYCGNAVFGATSEDQELEAPQGLIPMAVEHDAARQKARDWLGRGFLAPGDLAQSMLHSLQPVYAPLWLFNAAVALRPVGREKQVYLYASWVVPGLRCLSSRLVKSLGPFTWGKIIEFKPEYLAGWPASTYDVSAAIAAQHAKHEMLADARSRASRLPFDTANSPVEFSTESYWLVLFPIWIANYTYHRKIYRLLVNGQTGQVAGVKPVSEIKVLLVLACASVLIGSLGFGLLHLLKALTLPPEVNAIIQPALTALQPVSPLLLPIIVMLVVMVVIAFHD
jgi:DNA-directed RNA polymerase subunit RPC12/RpoP